MAEETLGVAFKGPAVDVGRMEVRQLAPALLALGELFREAGTLVDSEAPPVSLDISAVGIGSFELHLIVHQIEEAERLLLSQPSTALATLVGLVAAPANGILWLLKRIGRQTVVRQEPAPAPGMLRLTLNNGEVLEISEPVARLYNSITVRRTARDLVSPLGVEGIETLEIRRENEEPLKLVKEDLPGFRAIPAEEVEATEEMQTLRLRIVSMSFLPGYKWRFQSGPTTFTASIEDEHFMASVVSNEQFKAGDTLSAIVGIRKTVTDAGELRYQYAIYQVLDHISNPPQPTLFSEWEAEDESTQE